MPKLLSNVRHERMEQSQDTGQNMIHHAQAVIADTFLFALQFSLCRLQIPIAKIVPYELVERLRDLSEKVVGVGIFDDLNGLVQPKKNMSGIRAQRQWR